MKSYLSLLFGLIVCLIAFSQPSDAKPPKLLVLGVDAFRWDYAQYANTPNFDRMAKEGVHAIHGIKTTFISSTYPAYWTISTGLYPETHGIIDNGFWDPVLNESFPGPIGLKDPKWWVGEPIWATAKKQGKKVALNDWIANWITFNGTKADFVIPEVFNNDWAGSYPEQELFHRMDSATKWLIDDDCDLVMIYFGQPDHEGHQSGALSDKVVYWIESIDKFLGTIFDSLAYNNMMDEVNIIAFADHGMVNFTSPPAIDLADIIDIENDILSIPQWGAIAGIIPHPDKVKKVYKQLKANATRYSVYLKNKIPDDRHYKNNRRVTPIVVTADEGHLITWTTKEGLLHGLEGGITQGKHGYDSNMLNMNPFFYARGPDFKQRYATDVFETVNLYSLMSYLLRIKESPNDGSLANVQHMLSEDANFA